MLKARVITALILVAVLAAVLFALPPAAVAASFALVAALAGWEWAGLMRQPQVARVSFAVLIAFGCAALYTVVQFAVAPMLFVAAAFWAVLALPWLSHRWALRGTVTGYVLGALILLSTWAALLILQQASPWLLLAVMAVVWVADIGAYFAGRAFGRHKLAPRISPGKTWEGVAGGLAGVLCYGVIVITWSPLGAHMPFDLPVTVALLVLLTGLSVIGDLFESLLKRQADLKDSSRLLPGHGGILDRIDSLTSTLPLVALLLMVSR